jgi:hypothetical protein
MSFVYEKIDHSRSQEILHQVRPPIYCFQRFQVIDRERDLVFVCLGGEGGQPQVRREPPTYYNLLWKGIPVAFEGYDNAKFPQGTVTVDVKLTKLCIPDALINLVPEIQQVIIEAMTCFWSGQWERPATLTVQFPTTG